MPKGFVEFKDLYDYKEGAIRSLFINVSNILSVQYKQIPFDQYGSPDSADETYLYISVALGRRCKNFITNESLESVLKKIEEAQQ